MDKFESRRQLLLKILKERCDENVSSLARALGKEPSYVHRMLYEEGKPGRKRIGDDSVDKIREVFGVDFREAQSGKVAESGEPQLHWLFPAERELISNYRAATEESKNTLLTIAAGLPKSKIAAVNDDQL